MRTATSPKEAVELFYAAQNAGDTEQIAALMAEDVEYHDMVGSTVPDPSLHVAHMPNHVIGCKSCPLWLPPGICRSLLWT